MKICIPVTTKDGLNSLISEHFGRAPHHIVVDLETMKHYALDKEESEAHGHCLPVQMLIKHEVGTVLCKGIGRGALGNFIANEIQVLVSQQDTVAEAITAYKTGGMPFVGEDQVCQGHGDDHGHHH